MVVCPPPVPRRLAATDSKPASTSRATPLPTGPNSSTLLLLRMSSTTVHLKPLSPSRQWTMFFWASEHSSMRTMAGVTNRRWILPQSRARRMAGMLSPGGHSGGELSTISVHTKTSPHFVTVILVWPIGHLVTSPGWLGFIVESLNLSFGTDRALNRPFVRSRGPSLPSHVVFQVALSLTGLPFISATRALKVV